MAQLKKYKCKRCGYSILAHRKGHYSLMAGECYTFSCSECKEIVSLLVSDLAKQYYFLTCPNCGSQDSLTSWNPVDGPRIQLASANLQHLFVKALIRS